MFDENWSRRVSQREKDKLKVNVKVTIVLIEMIFYTFRIRNRICTLKKVITILSDFYNKKVEARKFDSKVVKAFLFIDVFLQLYDNRKGHPGREENEKLQQRRAGRKSGEEGVQKIEEGERNIIFRSKFFLGIIICYFVM